MDEELFLVEAEERRCFESGVQDRPYMFHPIDGKVGIALSWSGRCYLLAHQVAVLVHFLRQARFV